LTEDPRVTPEGPVLACFAHPDDAEICAGGTLAKFADAGREVHLLILTNGDRGSDDRTLDRAELAATRDAESTSAGEVLGLASVRILSDNHDGELENTAGVRIEIARRVREVRPAVVVTCDPTAWFFEGSYFNHSDHRTAGAVTLDAVFPGAGNPHFFEELLAEGLEPWKVPEVWIGWTLEPNHREDISATMQRKIDALARHASQLAEGIAFFEDFLQVEARREGERIGAEFAEPFRVMRLEG
jgi:LmbE family N-acetylglucosaminyl deacetylase